MLKGIKLVGPCLKEALATAELWRKAGVGAVVGAEIAEMDRVLILILRLPWLAVFVLAALLMLPFVLAEWAVRALWRRNGL